MIGLGTILVVALTSAAAAIALPGSPASRLDGLRPVEPARAKETLPSRWLTLAAAIALAVGAMAVIGGPMGAVVAVVVVAVGPRLLGRLETRGARRRREDMERQAPLVADLLASTLAGGVPVVAAIRAVADAVGEPSATYLRTVVAAIDLGAAPEEAWRGCAPELSPIADAAVRSARTGAPLTVLLRRMADDVARDRRRAVEVAARSAGVRAVAPLAACFLPAFLLVGVVPVVASLAGNLV